MQEINSKEWYEYNAKLQQKKNEIRKELKERGILQKKGKNDYDHYKYFSESQYKELFTELFSEHGLELNFNEVDFSTYTGSEKLPNGRMPKIEFKLIDIETGFYETSAITGDGVDKGDKGTYKAYTGALKYFLATKFMVATGDDPEKESPSFKGKQLTSRAPSLATLNAKIKTAKLTDKEIKDTLDYYKVNDFKELSDKQKIELELQLTKRIKGMSDESNG